MRAAAKVLMDNTWGIHHFQPFQHGVDVSIQALTKYAGGHSDVLLGSVTVNNEEDWERVRAAALALGQYASPDDCWLALRGLRTMAVRLKRRGGQRLEVARWLRQRPEVQQVMHPALPGAPAHELWKRDFTGACSLFGVVFQPRIQRRGDARASSTAWSCSASARAGAASRAWPCRPPASSPAPPGPGDFGGPMVRIHIGLEDPADLIADLEQGLARLSA